MYDVIEKDIEGKKSKTVIYCLWLYRIPVV